MDTVIQTNGQDFADTNIYTFIFNCILSAIMKSIKLHNLLMLEIGIVGDKLNGWN